MSVLNSPAIWASKCLAGKFLFLLNSWLLQKYFGQIKKHFTIACVCVGWVRVYRVCVCVCGSELSLLLPGDLAKSFRVFGSTQNGQNACTLSQVGSWNLQLAATRNLPPATSLSSLPVIVATIFPHTHLYLLFSLSSFYFIFFSLFLSLGHFLLAKKLLLLLPHLSAASPPSSISLGGTGGLRPKAFGN